MVTSTGHVFINISKTDHIKAVKFDRRYEENMNFLAIPKSPKEKVENIGLGSFMHSNTVSYSLTLEQCTHFKSAYHKIHCGVTSNFETECSLDVNSSIRDISEGGP